MKKKWIIILGMVIGCGIALPAVNWKETINKFRMYHIKKLIWADQSIDKAIRQFGNLTGPAAEAAADDDRPEYLYSRFVMTFLAAKDYKISGTKRVRAASGERTFEFELAVSGENKGLRETAGEESLRTVLSDGALYQIDESAGTMVQSGGGLFPDPLTEACMGKMISFREESLGGNPVKEYELYYKEAIYKMSFDGNHELKRLQKLAGDILVEYTYTDISWEGYDEALLQVDPAAYETIREIRPPGGAPEPEAVLVLPAEYPANELPLPESSELTSVKVNFDADKKGSMMITYVSGKGMEELKRHYVGCLQGSRDYIVSEEIRSGEKVTVFSGRAGDAAVELIEIKYNSARGKMQVNLLLNK